MLLKENKSGSRRLMSSLSFECSTCNSDTMSHSNNESINALVWIRCPKHKHHGATAVQCAAASAVCHFHCGASIREQIMEKLLVPAGKHTKKASHTKDKKRVAQSDLRATQKEKKSHQGQQLLNVRREKALKDAEGFQHLRKDISRTI